MNNLINFPFPRIACRPFLILYRVKGYIYQITGTDDGATKEQKTKIIYQCILNINDYNIHNYHYIRIHISFICRTNVGHICSLCRHGGQNGPNVVCRQPWGRISINNPENLYGKVGELYFDPLKRHCIVFLV